MKEEKNNNEIQEKNTEEKILKNEQKSETNPETEVEKSETTNEIKNENQSEKTQTTEPVKKEEIPTPPKKKSKIKTAINIITKIIVWAIIIILVAIIVRATVFHKYDVLGYRFYLIGSGSMEPTIHVGDAVAVKEANDFKEGDVIAFKEANTVIVHRIVKVYTEEDKVLYETKGDNNNTVDGGLRTKENILGKLVFTVKNASNPINFIKSHFIIIIAIIAIIAVIVIIRGLVS